MAAHITTALHNLLHRQPEGADLCKLVRDSASAPFWDTTLGFVIPWEYEYFSIMGSADRNEETRLRFQLEKLFELVNPIMKRFAKMEDFYTFKQGFINHGKPHWRKRADKFYKGEWEWDRTNKLTGGAPYTAEGQCRYERIAQGVMT